MQNVLLVVKPSDTRAAEVLSSKRAKRLAKAIEDDGLSTWQIDNCELKSVFSKPNTIHVTMSRPLSGVEVASLCKIISDIATG